MPIYEYHCLNCRRRFSRLLLSYSAATSYTPQCPYCHSTTVQRLISRVYNLKGESTEASDAASDDALADFDENDPRSMGRMMRRMSEESGEDMGPEFNEVVHRLESGQDPEQIERDLPNLADATAAGMDGIED
ncbi:MAG: zinc ribbon domain-containing protein [Chloroflexi bacterium]|nr:zinc ribbon domain-containing protein [Chloroflexota bacterium]